VKAESGAFKFELSPDGDAETYIIEARAGKAKTSVGVKGRGYYYWDGYYEGGGGGNRITSKPMAAADILIETDPVAYVGKTLKASFDAP
jgi:hypothetical protein